MPFVLLGMPETVKRITGDSGALQMSLLLLLLLLLILIVSFLHQISMWLYYLAVVFPSVIKMS